MREWEDFFFEERNFNYNKNGCHKKNYSKCFITKSLKIIVVELKRRNFNETKVFEVWLYISSKKNVKSGLWWMF